MACSIRLLTYRTIGASSLALDCAAAMAARSASAVSAMSSRSLSSRCNRSMIRRTSLRATTTGRITMPVAARTSSSATTSPGSVTPTVSSPLFIARPSTRCRSTTDIGMRFSAAGSGWYPTRSRVLMPKVAAAASVSCSSVTTWSLISTARTDRPLRCASAAAASTARASTPICFRAASSGLKVSSITS
jgi:hypothetical protein